VATSRQVLSLIVNTQITARRPSRRRDVAVLSGHAEPRASAPGSGSTEAEIDDLLGADRLLAGGLSAARRFGAPGAVGITLRAARHDRSGPCGDRLATGSRGSSRAIPRAAGARTSLCRSRGAVRRADNVARHSTSWLRTRCGGPLWRRDDRRPASRRTVDHRRAPKACPDRRCRGADG
jgi:hypothetical protein